MTLVSDFKARLAGAPDHMQRISPDAKIVDALFRVNDPMPYLASKFEPVKRRVRRLLDRV